ncbi:helix-turn-helix domain-containing protein [Nocardiopsis synnemataformans]
MKRERGHKARLYPTKEQLSGLETQGHAARALWNLLHAWVRREVACW